MWLPALQSGGSRSAHPDGGASLCSEAGRLRPVVGELAGLVVDRVRRLALPSAAVDECPPADSWPELALNLVGHPREVPDVRRGRDVDLERADAPVRVDPPRGGREITAGRHEDGEC